MLPPLVRWLTPAARRRSAVEAAARAMFVERSVHQTRSRCGVLVSCALAERQAAVVPDVGVAAAVPLATLTGWERNLTTALARGGVATAEAVAALAPTFAEAVPHALTMSTDPRRHPARSAPEAALVTARVLIAVLLALLVVPRPSHARPGGGGYTGSSGGSGRNDDADGSSSSDGGAALIWLIQLCIHYPKVGLPLLALLIGFVVYSGRQNRTPGNWDSAPTRRAFQTSDEVGLRGDWDDVRSVLYSSASDAHGARTLLEPIARVDPDFSSILFEDFAFRLYATAHGCRGEPGTLDELAPYLSARARKALADRGPEGLSVANVVIGRMRPTRVNVPSQAADAGQVSVIKVALEFEANYAVGTGPKSRRFAVEDWVLQRMVSARTKPPRADGRFPCPNCGAPWRTESAAGTQKCASCGEVVDNGRLTGRWPISMQQERDNLPGLEDEVPERGTSLPTVRDARVDEQWAELLRDDAQLTTAAFEARLYHIYRVVNDAWADRNLTPARTVHVGRPRRLSSVWLDAYAGRGLCNVLEDMRITRHEPATLLRRSAL